MSEVNIIKSISRKTVVADARRLKGVRWVHQGRNPATGIDCLGFLVHLCVRQGIQPILDRTDYPLIPPGDELQRGLKANLRLLTELTIAQAAEHVVTTTEAVEATVVNIQFPGESQARHVGILAFSEQDHRTVHILHALNAVAVKEVIEEPFARWIPYTVGYYAFPNLLD